jgi:hypothetical protein
MTFQDLVQAAQKYFPSLQIKYKNESTLMKILGTIMFFNKGFMTKYTTTLGSTVYFPSINYIKLLPASSFILLLHELVHMHDEKKKGKFIFKLSYLFPQVLLPFACFLFLLTWKIALPVLFLLALPLPAYWRMQYEKRAYIASLYATNKIALTSNFNPHLDTSAAHYLLYFQDSSYYFMWPFKSLKNEFDQCVAKIQAGQRPFDDQIFDVLDDLITKY